MKKIITLLFIVFFVVSCQYNNNDKGISNFENELTKAIGSSCWIAHGVDDNIIFVTINFFENKQFEISATLKLFDPGIGSEKIYNVKNKGSWKIEEDFIIVHKENNETLKYRIANDFSYISSKNGDVYLICKNNEKIEYELDKLKTKYNYSKKSDEYKLVEVENDPQIILNKVLAITGNFTQGKSVMGYVEGTSDIYLNGNNLKVDYSAIGKHATETGGLENLELSKGPNKSYAITGTWIRDIGGTGDFYLAIHDSKTNGVICKVFNEGGNWSYFKTKEVSNEEFKQIAKLLNYETDNTPQNNGASAPTNKPNQDGYYAGDTSNYQIQVKNGVKNVNVRNNYIVEQSKVLTRISSPETYTVIEEKIIKDEANAIHLLKTKTKLTDTGGRIYTFEPGKKVKLLATKGQFYNAEITLNNKTITLLIPVQNIETQYDQKWLFLKELNGWVLSEFVEKTSQNTNNSLLHPQEIDYTGKPDLEYHIEGKTAVLDGLDEDGYDSRYYIRMKFDGKEVNLKNIINETSKYNRVFKGSGYKVVFKIEEYGECVGEGSQYFHGEVVIEYKGKSYLTGFQGSDPWYSSKECLEIGNG